MAEAEQTDAQPRQRATERKRRLGPGAAADMGISRDQPAARHDHQRDREISDLVGEGGRAVGERDAALGEGLGVDLVQPGAVAGDELKRRQPGEQGAIQPCLARRGDAADAGAMRGKECLDLVGAPWPEHVEALRQRRDGRRAYPRRENENGDGLHQALVIQASASCQAPPESSTMFCSSLWATWRASRKNSQG
jgi:hypothetical protein